MAEILKLQNIVLAAFLLIFWPFFQIKRSKFTPKAKYGLLKFNLITG